MGPGGRVRIVAARKDSSRRRLSLIAQNEPAEIVPGKVEPPLDVRNQSRIAPGECSVARDRRRGARPGLEVAPRSSPALVRVEGMNPRGIAVGRGSSPASRTIRVSLAPVLHRPMQLEVCCGVTTSTHCYIHSQFGGGDFRARWKGTSDIELDQAAANTAGGLTGPSDKDAGSFAIAQGAVRAFDQSIVPVRFK